MVARRPGCPSQVFWVCKGVADRGDVVIEKRHFSNVDTRVPVLSTPVLFEIIRNRQLHPYPRRNKIFLARHHRVAYRM